jgi:hypothetical protein
MGLIRLIILALIAYFLYRVVKRLIMPSKKEPYVRGKKEKTSKYKNRQDIQDIDYEDIE